MTVGCGEPYIGIRRTGCPILREGRLGEGIDAGREAGDFEQAQEDAAGFVEREAGAEDEIFCDLDHGLFPISECQLPNEFHICNLEVAICGLRLKRTTGPDNLADEFRTVD